MKKKPVRRLRILALMHEALVPPDDAKGVDLEAAEWKTEYCVVTTLRRLGHTPRIIHLSEPRIDKVD